MENWKNLIDFKINFLKIIIENFIEIQTKVYFPEKFILKDIINYFKQKLEDLLRFDDKFMWIKLNKDNIEIIKKNKNPEIINLETDLKNEFNKIDNNWSYLEKINYPELYKNFNFDYVFGLKFNEFFYSNEKNDYVILFDFEKESNQNLFSFYSNDFCYKIKNLIIKTIEIFFSVQLKINLNIFNIFREIFEDIIIEIIENFDLMAIFKIYESIKKDYNDLNISSFLENNNDLPELIYKNNVLMINNVENSIELNFFMNQKLNQIINFKNIYLSLINNFKIWRNMDNYSIMFFNSNNYLLFYNFINSNLFNLDIIKHEIVEISLDYNKSYNMTNKSLDIKGISKSKNFYERIKSIINNMLDFNMDYFEISNPLIIFQIYKNEDNYIGFCIMIKNIINKNFSEENFWKKFNFVLDKNTDEEEDIDLNNSIIKNKSYLINENKDELKFSMKKFIRRKNKFKQPNILIDSSDKNSSNKSPSNNYKIEVNSNHNNYDTSNFSKNLSKNFQINLNPNKEENLDKSILMEFIPDKEKKRDTNKKRAYTKNIKKSIFINHFNDKELQNNFSKNIKERKEKYKDNLLNNLDEIIYRKENVLIDFDKFLNKKPELNTILNLNKFDNFDSWGFDTLNLNQNELCKVIIDIVEAKNWFNLFNISKFEFLDFLWKCNFYYSRNNNYFHNFKHGITVAHSINQLFKIKFIDLLLNEEQKFALFISAIGHDLDHRGKTNSFEINTLSNLALNYHDKSPLEQHHCYILFKILSIENTNLFKQFNSEIYKNLREIIISSILFTDMKVHFQLLSEIKLKLENNDIKKENEDFLKLCGFTLHLADLNGPSKKFEICLEWSKLLNKEFTNQYEEENKLNLPLTPHFKDLKIPKVYYNNEYKFMKFLIIPLYDVFYNLIEEDDFFTEVYDNTLNNMENYYNEYIKIENEEKENKEDKEGNKDIEKNEVKSKN